MKRSFFKKLSIRFAAVPLVLSVLLSIAGGAVLHFFGDNYLMQDICRPHALNLLAEKKYSIDAWLQKYKRQSEDMSNNRIVWENVTKLVNVEFQSNRSTQKKGDILTVAQQDISRFLKEVAAANDYNVIAILSMTGRVISSTEEEVIGEDWSGRDFFKDALPGLDKTVVKGSRQYGDSGFGVVSLSPIHDAGQKVIAVVYCLSSADKFIKYLTIAQSAYRTEQVMLVNEDGSIMISDNGSETKKMGETAPRDIGKSHMVKHNGVLYFQTDLNEAPLRLVSAVMWSEVSWPLGVMMIFYSSLTCAMILIVVIQGTYMVSKFLTKPIERLTAEVQSVAEGRPVVGFGEGFKGELSDLSDALKAIMHVSNERESHKIDEIKEIKRNERLSVEKRDIQENSEFSAVLLERAFPQLRDICNALTTDAEKILDGNDGLQACDRRRLLSLTRNSRKTLRFMDNLTGLLNFVGTPQDVKPEEYYLCELLKEVEQTAQSIVGSREICLVIECDDKFAKRAVSLERARLKHIINYLVGHCLGSIDVGTVTVLASLLSRDDKEYAEIFIVNAQGDGELEKQEGLIETDGHAFESLGLDVVKKAILALGGQMAVENVAGKGFFSAVTIPLQSDLP